MGHLILPGENTNYEGLSLLGESSLAITMEELGIGDFDALRSLTLSGTTAVSVVSTGAVSGQNFIHQLIETTNNLTTVTTSGAVDFFLRGLSNQSNNADGVVTDIAATAASPTTIHSSLTLINASATTGGVNIEAGATNTSSDGQFLNNASLNANVTITYTGLTIKGGSGTDGIENDAKKGIVTDGNGSGDFVILGGAGATAVVGTGATDQVDVGKSFIGTHETAGSALGDKVTFGAAATALLVVGTGAEAGSTAGTASIGLTKVVKAADGMQIDFTAVTTSHFIADETAAVASATNLTAAENAAVNALGGAGVAYFSFNGNEYFIATDNAEAAISSR
jgi:hypothetical protein